MKRVLLTVAVALLIPSILAAAPITVGVYYEGSHACVPPSPGVPFLASLVMVQNEYNVTAIEYALEIWDALETAPSGWISIQGWTLPGGSETELGNPITGHSVAYWPPLNGFPTGYNLLVNYSIVTFAPCETITDHHINVVPHPDTGQLRCTTAPDGDKVGMVGLTLWFCPSEVGTEESSWGAIKGQYK